MRMHFAGWLIVAAIAVTGSAAFGAPATMTLATAPVELPDGNWEYIYDVYGHNSHYIVGCGLSGFDAGAIVNQWTYTYGGVTGTVAQQWEWLAANNRGTPEAFGSSSADGTTWTLHGQPWAIDNIWHTPDEYVNAGPSYYPVPQWLYPGQVSGDGQSLGFGVKVGAGNAATSLVKTFRIVHANAPGEISYSVYSYYAEDVGSGTVLGPAPVVVRDGDFDEDGDVDADDVDTLCANMGGDVATYDMNGDLVVDEDDMVFHVETYLDVDTDGDGVTDGAGTFRGDFNTDGSVNGTDLSIMNGGFGASVGFAGGNANCDSTVNGTDLSILAGVFGNVATAAVPEPLTLGLLSLGAVGLLRRPSRRSAVAGR